MAKEQRWEELTPEQRKQNARLQAIVLGGATIISLMFLVFAYVTKERAAKRIGELQEQVNRLELDKQSFTVNMEAMIMAAEHQRRNAEESLKACMESKKK